MRIVYSRSDADEQKGFCTSRDAENSTQILTCTQLLGSELRSALFLRTMTAWITGL